MKEINNSCLFNSELLKISNPTLRVILQNKKAIAEENEIEFKLFVKSNFGESKVTPMDLTVIFGNLLDNSVDVVNLLSEQPKEISFEVGETDTKYYFLIKDNGLPINENVVKNMFSEGYSTKGEGRGFGLALVKKTIKKYGGKILFDQDLKIFNIILPKYEG